MPDTPIESSLVYLTNPRAGECVLNVQTMVSGEFLRFTVSRDQLFGLNKTTAEILLKDYK